jgi:thiamine biosynthesis lipoprotein
VTPRALHTAPATSLAWEWQATGTVWRIHHDGCVGFELAEAAGLTVEHDEARWSRFRATSEVAQISAAAGSPVRVSPETLELLAACLAWQDRTDGVFDPLVGAALNAWGYTNGMQHRAPQAATSPDTGAVGGRIELDHGRGTARIPAGAQLDLGGIGKGWIADRVARLLRAARPVGRILVDAGGDLVAARGAHLVAVEGDPPAWIPLDEGSAVATSGWRRRSWRNGDGRAAHHLIDPETGAPGLRSCATVLAETAAAADVLAKTLALRPERLAGLSIPARVDTAGGCRTTGAWDAIASGAERERAA